MVLLSAFTATWLFFSWWVWNWKHTHVNKAHSSTPEVWRVRTCERHEARREAFYFEKDDNKKHAIPRGWPPRFRQTHARFKHSVICSAATHSDGNNSCRWTRVWAMVMWKKYPWWCTTPHFRTQTPREIYRKPSRFGLHVNYLKLWLLASGKKCDAWILQPGLSGI